MKADESELREKKVAVERGLGPQHHDQGANFDLLLVEDQMLIAMDVELMLADNGITQRLLPAASSRRTRWGSPEGLFARYCRAGHQSRHGPPRLAGRWRS